MKPVDTFVVIDGININATHYGKKSKEDAVKAMKEDGVLEGHSKSEKWAADVHAKMQEVLAPVKELPADAGESKKK